MARNPGIVILEKLANFAKSKQTAEGLKYVLPQNNYCK